MDNNQPSPVFIVSSGRAGTTLLRGMLNASNQLYIPHESDFLSWAYPLYKDSKTFDEKDYRQIVSLFAMSSQRKGWGMDKDDLVDRLKQLSPRSFSEVNQIIYETYLSSKGLSNLQWGIKHPVLIASIDKILKVFPNAKIVHIVRDGRDVCMSYQAVHKQDRAKFGPKGVLTNALYWTDGLRRVAENQSQQIYELRYEDLLTQPKEELKKLCQFLNIEFSDTLHQSYYRSENNKDLLLSNHRKTIHAKVDQGIDVKNQQKFLTGMSKLDRFIFEVVAYPYLKNYGYLIEFSTAKNPILGVVRAALYQLARSFNNWRYRKRHETAFKQLSNP